MFMSEKPTYEELEQRINELEKHIARCEESEADLTKFMTDSCPDAAYFKDLNAGFSKNIDERNQAHIIHVVQLRLIKYAANHTVMELLQKFLDEAELLTRSKIGFYHFLEDDQMTLSLQTWSTNTLKNMCKADGNGLHYPIYKAGVWVDCIRERKPVIHNCYERLPHKRGLPEGHAPVLRELVVPVFREEKIVAILGVGNKRTDYDVHDVETLRQLADLAWETVTHKRAEEEIRQLNETLEQRISQRTAELENRAELLQRLALELSGTEDRERRHIASILHDDFQQHLAFIKMELDVASKKVGQKVGQRLDRLSKLTAECIEKSRHLSYELNPPALHCSGLLAAIDALARDMETKQGLVTTVRTHPDAEPVSLSLASILYRSARELLLNVVKHAGVNSAAIDIRSKKGLIYLTVEDCGNGFDIDEIKARQSRGAGFGLYNIKDRMTSLGGSMKVKSKPGKGCRVVLTVPKAVSQKAAGNKAAGKETVWEFVRDVPAEPIQPTAGKKHIHVLLADDHQLIREALANLLKRHEKLTIVGQAVNGREAVEMAEKLKPHVVLMDVTMPELNGIEATTQIIRNYPEVLIIGLSMNNDVDTRQKMLDAGASAYLCKTDSPDTVIRSILKLYQEKSEERQS
jgi:signal transduction histidine kinase/ActR/RegA family two-component response regulator